MSIESKQSVRTRQSLLKRLKQWNDSISWNDFFETYWQLIYSVARKADLSDAEAQDVVQETIISVAKKMPEFDYDPAIGSFKAWLMRLTHWRIADQLRKRGYESAGNWKPREQPASGDVLDGASASVPFDLEAVWEQEWQTQILDAALQRVREHADSRQFQMFYLHVCKNLPAREVTRKLQAKLPEVYFAKYKISAAVRREIRKLEEKML
jgi:RNA polymerase sigma-70 factor (ECF subfamily)